MEVWHESDVSMEKTYMLGMCQKAGQDRTGHVCC